ncbi:acyltransferase family protein [Ancylobacter polymorphus]|uniref:Peptidoglycan/LPS O-acetylase OafA/YrhL n=1 Tax=Ancylobacter polymorphus TaxID=223390 RepID=A0ABU0BEZ6_9HYPH|nr:acyltransferase family protein [Ancylobacter polymorphus]MDQ0304407.1 peptidoglycan/LPS O-acetylase OafA/YrhL [Ancylobacter polymorphus]
MKYRSEIDGLRAVAVVPVILFHAGFGAFSGGYVGVDVFFVISGYLITIILLNEIEAGTFSIARFYERRARRIVPALSVVMLACLPFAWLWMIPEQLKEFGQSLTAVVLSVSNFLFWKQETSYFAAAAELKPLLHTWSLAVEEQYYLFAPLTLVLLWRFGRRRLFWIVVAAAVLGLLATEWGWRYAPRANFYLSQFRIWELQVGSICGFLATSHPPGGKNLPRASNGLSALGLGMILFAIFAFDKNTPFPSLYTLVPVGGTALVVLFAHKGTVVARVLSARVLVGIGLISYSAYLWHQPLFAFARIRSLVEPEPALMMALAVLSMGLAYLSWRFVEQPFRRRPVPLLPSRRAVFTATVLVGVVFATIGLYANLSGGVPSRLDRVAPGSYAETLLASLRRPSAKLDCAPVPPGENRAPLCAAFTPENPKLRILLIGDSHAGSILRAFAGVGRDNAVYQMALPGCPPINRTALHRGAFDMRECQQATRDQLQAVREGGFDVVVLAARWSLYAGREDRRFFALGPEGDPSSPSLETSRATFSSHLAATVQDYRALGAAVVLIDQVPEHPVMPRKVIEQAVLLGLDHGSGPAQFEQAVEESSTTLEANGKVQGFAEAELDKLRGEKVWVLSFDELFAHGGRYLWGDRNGAYYIDGDHLSPYGAALIEPAMTAAFTKIAEELKAGGSAPPPP